MPGRLRSKRTNSWTATGSGIQDSFTSFGNALKRELKERRTLQQASNDNSKIGNVGKIDNYELDESTVSQTGSARRGRFSLSGLIIRTKEPQARQTSQGPLLGDRQQQQHLRNPSQSNVPGNHGRLTGSSSFSQPPQLPKPASLSPFDLLSPSSPWSPPASDTTPPLPPLPSSIGNVDNGPDANGQLLARPSDNFPSLRPPTPIAKEQADSRDVSLDIGDSLRVPAPISKFQPTWDPYTATPLFEEEGFDFHEQSSREPSASTTDNPGPDSLDSDLVVIVPGTTETSRQTEPQLQLHGAQAQGHKQGKDKGLLSEEASMAAYTAQQQQPQPQQQQFNHGSYANTAPVGNNYQGQYNQSQASHSHWQAPPAQTPNQAWEQSQLYDYQPVQAQASGQQPQQPPTQQYQYAQQQQQQDDDSLPHRQSSFVGLPPIRRTSTLLDSVVKVGGEDDNHPTSIASAQQPGQAPAASNREAMDQPQSANQMQTPHLMQGTPQQYQITGAYRPSQPGALPPQQGTLQQREHASPQLGQNFQQSSPGLHGRAFSGPVHPQGVAIPNGDPRFSPQPQVQGQSSAPHLSPAVVRQNAGAVSPNGGGHIRLPPQGAWKLEESHLQQPLLSPSRNRSPSNATTPTQQSQPFYGFDKETGLPAPAHSPSQQPQASQAGQQPPLNTQGQPQPGQVLRTDTADTADTADLPPPGLAQAADDRQAKRNSGLFSNMRGRFSREGPEDRRDSAAGPTGHPTSDAISESSVATEELQERRKRHSFFGGHGSSQLSQPPQQAAPNGAPGNFPLAKADVNNAERTENQIPPSAYDQRIQQAAQPQSMPPPEKKKTFFGLPLGPTEQTQPARPDMSRASTSSNTITQADAADLPPAGINGGPKKRFSGLTSKMFNRSGNNQNGQKPPGSSHSARPSFSQGPPGGPQAGPQSFSGGFNGGFAGSQQGQFARQPGGPGPVLAQQAQQHQGILAQQQLRQQGYPQYPQPGPIQGQQDQQSPPQHSPQQQPQRFQQDQQVRLGQQPAQQPRPVGQQSPNMGSTQSSGMETSGHRTLQGQQHPFPGQQQQQGQQPVQQPVQQQPSQLSPAQQQQQFQQQRLAQQQPDKHLPSPPQQHQQFQQRPVQQQPSQQSLSQQQQQFQQQQERGQQQPGLMGPPPPIGRGRSDSMGTRPFTPGDSRPNPMMTHSGSSTGEEQGGRKPSGSGFFSSIFSGRSGSKSRDLKPGQGEGQLPGQQAMPIPQGGPQQPGQQQQPGRFPGQHPNQYHPGQQMIPSPLAQQQQQDARAMGALGRFGPPQPGQQQPGQAQFMPQGTPGPQQFAQQRQVSGQQRPQGSGQQPPQTMIPQGGAAGQQGQAQAGGLRPMMYPQLLSQQSQASIASASVTPGQQQPGLVNGQRTPSMGQLYSNQQAQAREPVQRTSLGPLNQHPPLQTSPPPRDTMREETVSPPIDDAASKTGPPGSPPLNSPISQVSTPVPFSPVERLNNDSQLSYGQPAPAQQQHQAGQDEPPRQPLQTSTPAPPNQSPARKPVQSVPRPPQSSQPSSVHGGSDHSKGSPSISSVHTATATASPIDHSRRPSQQFIQLGPQRTGSPLAQQPQLANQQQPLHRVPIPEQSPAPQPGSIPSAGFPGQNGQPRAQPGQTQGGPPSQMPPNQQGMRLVGQQQPGQVGAPAPVQQGQPYPGSHPPWMAGRTSTGASGPGPQQGQQQGPGPYFQVHPQNNGQDKESKGTMSKLLNKVTHTGSSQDKPEKEKSGKSRFGFLRSSKQSEQRQQPLQGGPQFQGPPGRPVMPQESQIERLQQLQAQVSPSEAQPRPSATPSPGPHLNYQHQRQSPPNENSPQLQPTAGSTTPSPGPQQALSAAQGAPSRPPQQQQGANATPQHGVPRPEQGQLGQGPPSGTQGRAGFPGSGQMPKPVNRPASAAQEQNEPRYGDVPIPTGYGMVHSEGRVEPAPVAYYMGPHGQFLPVQTGAPGSQPHVQPWVQPGMAQRQPSYGLAQQQHPGQGGQSQPQPTQQPVNKAPVASPPAPAATPGFPAGGIHPHQPDLQHPLTVQNPDQQTQSVLQRPQGETPHAATTPNAFSPAPDSQIQGYSASANNAVRSRPEPEGFSTAMSNPASPPPQLQHPASPQSYPLPDSTFSPVNPAAADAPTPPLPSPLPNPDLVPLPLRPLSNQLQMAVPQRQVSAVSQVSSLQPGSSQGPPPGAHLGVDAGGYLDARSPSPQVTPERSISPELPTLSPPPQTMHINVQQANEHGVEQDNIYEATPRTETIPIQQPTQESIVSPPADEPAEPKAGGMSHEVLEHRDNQDASPPQNLTINTHTSPSPSPPLLQPAPVQQTLASSTDATNGTPPPSRLTPPAPSRLTPPAPSNPADIFEEAKRKAMIRDMEEKIPVFPTEPDVNAQELAEMAAKKKAEEERPQMSATSYPGQEWNPYGEGWDDDE